MKIKFYYSKKTEGFKLLEGDLQKHGITIVPLVELADIVVAVGPMNQYMAYIEAKQHQKPLYCWMDEVIETQQEDAQGNIYPTKLTELFTEVFEYATNIWTSCSQVSDDLQKTAQQKSTVIGMPSNVEEVQPIRTKQPNKKPYLYYDGIILGPYKNLDGLLLAMNNTDYALHISGDPNFFSRVYKAYLPSVEMSSYGVVDNNRRQMLIKNASIVVNPSTDVTLDMLSIDAVLLGSPILVADIESNQKLWGKYLPAFQKDIMDSLHRSIKEFKLEDVKLKQLQSIAEQFLSNNIAKKLLKEIS